MIRRDAFTIIELLVVIAIISILAGLMLPAMGSARSLARDIDCKSSLKSLAVAVQVYAQNSGDYYPPAWNYKSGVTPTIATPSITWVGGYYKVGSVSHIDVTRGPLWPYLKQREVTRCKVFTPVQVKYAGTGEISGYGINSLYVGGSPIAKGPGNSDGMLGFTRPARLGEIKNPAQTVLFADCARVKSGVVNEEILLYAHDAPAGIPAYATFHFRHDGHANAAFCDGHVDSIDPFSIDPSGDGKCGWIANELMDRE